MSNGWVAPCPYFPLVFGDATREPIIDIFERIHGHPLVRLGGDYCPMRNEEYINTHIRKLGLDRPFFPIRVDNQINLGAPCGAGCPGCAHGAQSNPRPAEDIVRELGNVPPEYSRIQFYGGDAFLRDDLFAILDRVPPATKITLWSTCSRLPKSQEFVERLRCYSIEAIKVPLPLQFNGDIACSDPGNGFKEALQGATTMGGWGLPIHLYVPMDRMGEFHAAYATRIHQLGLERLYGFTRNRDQSLVNSVACFGRELERVRLLWVQEAKQTQGPP
jgi:hypothetical protein